MNRIETLANDIALLSNSSLHLLAQTLVRDYPTRADTLSELIRVTSEDEFRKICEELGVTVEEN